MQKKINFLDFCGAGWAGTIVDTLDADLRGLF